MVVTGLVSIAFSQTETKPVEESDEKILDQIVEKKKSVEKPKPRTETKPNVRPNISPSVKRMTIEKMDKILKAESKKVEGQVGNWQIDFNGLPMIVVTDKNANRMRIISPIGESKKLDEETLRILLKANFSTALDAKYAIFNDVLWSTYVHPLGELTDEQFKDALRQVFNLTKNFGTSFSSTGVIFGTQQQQAPEREN